MVEADYRVAWQAATQELESITRKIDALNIRRMQLQQTIRGLSALITQPNDVKTLDNTILSDIELGEAILVVLRRANSNMPAKQIRDMLSVMGFDLSRFSNSMSAIHNCLKRLAESGKITLQKTKSPFTQTSYSAKV